MKPSIFAAILLLLCTITCLIECRIVERPHWSFGAFPSPNVQGPFPGRPSFSNKFSPNHMNSLSGGPRFPQLPSNAGFQNMSPERQQYLLGLAATILRHKQIQSQHSTRLLNSFGSHVAPFNKKKK